MTHSSPKVLFITTPIRPVPTDFPPMGSLSVITALRQSGWDNVHFYNIDLLRPSYPQAVDHIVAEAPDILAISAVVSTAYDYTKKMSLDIKRRLPGITILLGGNLGASAEIVLKKTGVDFICTGKGEQTIVDFLHCFQTATGKANYNKVKGLAFLNEKGELQVTPFSDPIPPENIYEIDWSILDDLGQSKFFFPGKKDSQIIHQTFFHDLRTDEPHRQDKTLGFINGSNGCVARCTFCHRWEKGIHYIPVPVVMRRLDEIIERYNVGFVNFGDENFGTDRKWLAEFIREIKKRDVIWRVSGMRVNTLTREFVRSMKDAGCATIFCGMESGSQKMLNLMEKATTAEQNKNAVKWLAEWDVYTIVQLIIGMPGETPETIRETIEFTSYYAQQSPENDPNALSINFAQALPGTPLYEVGRRLGVIGQNLDEEEKYLSRISDRDARDGDSYVNFTGYPKLSMEKWYFDILIQTRRAYIERWGWDNYYRIVLRSGRYSGFARKPSAQDTGYFADPARSAEQGVILASSDSAGSLKDQRQEISEFRGRVPSLLSLVLRLKPGAVAVFYPRLLWRFGNFFTVFVFFNTIRKFGLAYSIRMLAEYGGWIFRKASAQAAVFEQNLSLRKILRKKLLPDIADDNPSMAQLRKGR